MEICIYQTDSDGTSAIENLYISYIVLCLSQLMEGTNGAVTRTKEQKMKIKSKSRNIRIYHRRSNVSACKAYTHQANSANVRRKYLYIYKFIRAVYRLVVTVSVVVFVLPKSIYTQ